MASDAYGSYGYADDDELNYMQNVLSDNNIKKIQEIAKKIGVSRQKTYELVGVDGEMKDFFRAA
ncbi:MAG: hypothetical protein U5L95_02635 [Candidatus Saccharibacteria bacterium]|nr:hypothetical protein [Candidatus Saccharibacteria bacterium]